MVPRIIIIGDRQYFSGQQEWLTQLQCIEAVLPDYPTVALQIRSKKSTAVKDIYAAMKVISPTNQIFLNGSWTGTGYQLHLPENQIGTPSTEFFGASIHSELSLIKAQESGAHYVQFGAVFTTQTKPVPPLGLSALAKVSKHSRIPVFAVGGITLSNAQSCIQAGASGLSIGTWLINSNQKTLRQRLDALLLLFL